MLLHICQNGWAEATPSENSGKELEKREVKEETGHGNQKLSFKK